MKTQREKSKYLPLLELRSDFATSAKHKMSNLIPDTLHLVA